jgi:hypothetical protein
LQLIGNQKFVFLSSDFYPLWTFVGVFLLKKTYIFAKEILLGRNNKKPKKYN